jgi:Gpi18-like mannosyltransferase
VRWRELALVACGAAVVYLPLAFVPAPDLKLFLIPWLRHIEATGPITAFAHPFSNYSPPYLYLLSAISLLHLPEFVAIKLLGVAGACWLAWCASRLIDEIAGDPLRGAERVLLLPTVILNAPVLGQCDTFWVGCCILAITEAIKGRSYRMALWAGAAFAFKAQAAFLAPFFIGHAIQKRAWGTAAIPPLVYFVAIAPAALAGWPLANLLTIYLHQSQFTLIGDAANLWAIPAALNVSAQTIFPFAYALGIATALAAILFAVRGRDLMRVALLSALIVPFFLPKMLERFFFPADVLSLVIAFSRRDRRSIVIAALIQAGSFLSIVAYLHEWPWLNAAASLFIAAGLIMTLGALFSRQDVAGRHWSNSGLLATP